MSDPPAAGSNESLTEERKKEALRDQATAKDVMSKIGALVRASKGLPRLGDDYELCDSFSAFNMFMTQQEIRLHSLISRVMETAGCPVKPAKVGSTVGENLAKIVNANDSLVERLGIVMDEIERAGRDEEVQVPKAIVGAESTKQMSRAYVPFSSLSTPLPDDLSVRLKVAREKQLEFINSSISTIKPQAEFNLSQYVDNSRERFVSKLRTKHHTRDESRKGITIVDEDASEKTEWTGTDCDYGHPYRIELDHFAIPPRQMESSTPQKFAPLEKSPLTIVNTVEGLKKLRDALNREKEFAVDLEHNDTRSFLGLTCLIQISTRTEDVIIDPFPIWNEMHILNEPFTNPNILKVFHGAELDIQWLQRDFGIHVVNMFDTFHAMKRLEFPRFSLLFLVQKYCNITLNKQYQTSDWRIRPLLKEQMEYARCDTHYLLYCHDELREALIEKGNEVNNLLTTVYNDSALVCGKAYEKPSFDPQGFEHLSKRTFNSRQVYALRELWAWRDNVARKEDEGTQYVLPNQMMVCIAEALPREVQGIAACCNPVPEMVKQYVMEIHKMVYAARDQPLILGFVQKSNDVVEGNLLQTMIDEQNRMTRLKSVLRSRIDFSHTRFDEEIGKLNLSEKEALCQTPYDKSMLGFLDAVDVNNTIVVDETSKLEGVRDKVLCDLNENWATPYECYKIGVEKATEREAQRKEEEERRKKECGEGEKKQFSHHDPSAVRAPTTTAQVNVDNIAISSSEVRSRFTEDQILTKKGLAKKRKQARKAADIKFGRPVGDDEDESEANVKEEVVDDDAMQFSEEVEGEAPSKKVKVENVDYSTFDKNMFNKKKDSSDAFDPFHQKFRVENKKNGKKRAKAGFTRTGTMTTGYKPDAKKQKK